MGLRTSSFEREQQRLGPQSYRGTPNWGPMELLKDSEHAKSLFQGLFENEERLGGQYAVFYHSYSHSALLYEVRAAAAAVLHGFCPDAAPLPRLLAEDFEETPDAAALMRKVAEEWGPTKSDHREEFRRVGISVMCSLLATGPECCMQVAFFEGYSCKKIAFRSVLEEELRRAPCVLPERAAEIVDRLLELAAESGLDTSILGGQPSPSGHAGHLLQVFVRRDLVDQLCYPALPYGEIDQERIPFSVWLSGGHSFGWGQARILAHPKFFLDSRAVKMFAVSADPTFHANRGKFQQDLQKLLSDSVKQLRAELVEK